jgi:hypothetical protein
MGAFLRSESNDEDNPVAAQLTSPTAVAACEQHGPLFQLPPEIIYQILSYLSSPSLVSLSRSCHKLRSIAQNDLLWAQLLRDTLPSKDFPENPFPSSSYHDLYLAHHPYWFLPKHKIWISDDPHVGRFMICRFDARRGCIEGYRLLAERNPSLGVTWPHNPAVQIHLFNPLVHLWLDDPLIKLPYEPRSPSNKRHHKQHWPWDDEVKMTVGRPGYNTSASVFLTRNIPETLQNKSMSLWPPATIPSMPRVRAASHDRFKDPAHRPTKYEEMSQTTFRMRHWSQFRSGMSHFGVRMGEEVSTWSTLDPALFTPTAEKPYNGIYVGDYAAHGCEFLLVMQTDKAPPVPEPRGSSLYYRDTQAYYEAEAPNASNSDTPNRLGESNANFQGAIEAIKLTGDPNIPRGEHSFIADDIGPNGFIRVADEQPFPGARIVKSRGHVAARGFQDGQSAD